MTEGPDEGDGLRPTRTSERSSKAERGRVALVRQVKQFFRESWSLIVDAKAGDDLAAMLAMFLAWMDVKAVKVSALSESQRNIFLSRMATHWDDWVEVSSRALMEFVQEGVLRPDIPRREAE